MFSQPRSTVPACYRIVIYVSMIMLDDLGIHDRSHMDVFAAIRPGRKLF